MTLQGEELDRATKPFLEHLADLRCTIVWCAALLTVGMLVAIPFAPAVLDILKVPVARANVDPDSFLRVIKVAGGFSITVRIIFWCGVILGLPGMLLAVAWFLFPGLTRKERHTTMGAVAFATVLFAGGVCMAYFLTLPVALRWMFRVNDWMGIPCGFVELADYVSFALKLMVGFGIACELPVVVLALGSMGIVSAAQLREKRPHVIVVLLIIAMLLTPPDVITQLLMAIPMAILYEICIWIIWAKERSSQDRA